MSKRRFKDDGQERLYQAYLSIDPALARRQRGSIEAGFLNGYEGKRCKYIRTSLVHAAYAAGLEQLKKKCKKND